MEDLHRQHVWPRWLRDAVPWGRELDTHVRHDSERTIVHQAPPFTRTVRAVCQVECNGGWMSQLENAAKAPLLAMILGEDRILDEPMQRLIAFWALQTTLVFQCADRMKWVPASHYDELYAGRAIPKTTLPWRPLAKANVMLGAYRGSQRRAGFHPQPLEITPSTPDSRLPKGSKAYGVTMNLGHLVIQLLAHDVKKLDFTLTPSIEGAVVPIWPSAVDPVQWPPSHWLDDAGLASMDTVFQHLGTTDLPPHPEGSV